jgi:hypothetical protein
VIERAEPFALSANADPITITLGQKVELTVTAARNPGADGEIKLEFRGLPEKVTATPAAIPAGQSEVKVTLTAAADAPISESNVVVVGRLGAAAQPAPVIPILLRK